MKFSYQEFTTRNIGFVSEKEQEILRKTKIFVPGVGGMGGAAVACLARLGVENFIIADIDVFEISNLNRQIFSSLDVMEKDKAETAKNILLKINPDIKIELYNGRWVNELDKILPRMNMVVNGCDDVKATISLMRKCKQYKIPAIDAFASPLPNVYVIKPEDRRPEEVFGFPTVNLPVENITKEIAAGCLQKEIEHVMTHSSSAEYVDLNTAKEIMNGTRKRISFAPMVWATGCLMAYEAVKIALKKPTKTTVKGIFFNPWTYQIEKPKSWLMATLKRFFVRRFMKSL